MLGTVPTTDTYAALCCLTPPAPRMAWHGESSPGPCSLGINKQDQLLPLSLGYPLPSSYSLGTRARRAPTTAQPLHRLGLDSLRCPRSGTGTSPAEHAIPYVELQELPCRVQGLAPVVSELAYPRHHIGPASALHVGQTFSNQHASNGRRHAYHHRSTHVAPVQRIQSFHRPRHHSVKLQGSDTPPLIKNAT